MTQLERMKSMSAEEMANIITFTSIFPCSACKETRNESDCNFDCVNNCVIWLNSQIKEKDNAEE